MNKELIKPEVQHFILQNENANIEKVALSKSPFPHISSAELANQIKSRKQASKKLPTWHKTENIIYPNYLSIEQCSSEETATYKASLIQGNTIIDLTAGFGVDSTCMAKTGKNVKAIEQQTELVEIAQHNGIHLNLKNVQFESGNSINYLINSDIKYDAIYIDPARRLDGKKVYHFSDCEPNVVEHQQLLLTKSSQIWIKSAPFLDIQAGLMELQNVKKIHIISLKNECKELLWNVEDNYQSSPHIICHCIGPEQIKVLEIPFDKLRIKTPYQPYEPDTYLYEPDAALLKSGAFSFIAEIYNIHKIHPDSHIYWSKTLNTNFPGRIFKTEVIINNRDLKKQELSGNVIVRNYPDKAENLVKKYKIKPHNEDFLIFTKDVKELLIIKAKIIQHY